MIIDFDKIKALYQVKVDGLSDMLFKEENLLAAAPEESDENAAFDEEAYEAWATQVFGPPDAPKNANCNFSERDGSLLSPDGPWGRCCSWPIGLLMGTNELCAH